MFALNRIVNTKRAAAAATFSLKKGKEIASYTE
jgi:hypothetical protein